MDETPRERWVHQMEEWFFNFTFPRSGPELDDWNKLRNDLFKHYDLAEQNQKDLLRRAAQEIEALRAEVFGSVEPNPAGDEYFNGTSMGDLYKKSVVPEINALLGEKEGG
jgi:hypothetical protein